MEKTIYTPHYDWFKERFKNLRRSTGLSQRALAKKVRREQNFVGRLEIGERRLDIVEFFWLIKALGMDPERLAAEVMREFKALDRKHAPPPPRPTPKRRRSGR